QRKAAVIALHAKIRADMIAEYDNVFIQILKLHSVPLIPILCLSSIKNYNILPQGLPCFSGIFCEHPKNFSQDLTRQENFFTVSFLLLYLRQNVLPTVPSTFYTPAPSLHPGSADTAGKSQGNSSAARVPHKNTDNSYRVFPSLLRLPDSSHHESQSSKESRLFSPAR